MVKVATNLDVPIKLLWPKSVTFATERGFTMLGLGDIVIPGMFVATALRYDYHRASKQGSSATVSKTYFYGTLFAYAAGLTTTMSVMHFFRKAQPALLYLRYVMDSPIQSPFLMVDQPCLHYLLLPYRSFSRRAS